MRSHYIRIFFSSALIILLTACQRKDAAHSEEVEAKVLKTHHTLMSNKNLLLGLPVRIKYDDETNRLFIEDLAKGGVVEINDSSEVVHVFGKKGHGPGEVQAIDNFFITQKHLFIVDGGQYLINKYSRRDGHYITSLDYEKFLKHKIPPHLPLTDINNEPFVMLNENILLPTQAEGRFLYKLIDWKGNKLGDIGAIPKGYTTKVNKDKYWSALENKKIPARDLSEAFPVNDPSDPDNIYLVYSAIPKIVKYSLSGRKIWEHKINRTPEVDSLMINLSVRAKVVKNHPDVRVHPIPVRKYVAGRCSPDGDLYLITYTDPSMPDKYHRPIWIHQFDPEGKLVKRYKIVSNVDLSFYPGIDFKKHRLFFPIIKDINIRTYNF